MTISDGRPDAAVEGLSAAVAGDMQMYALLAESDAYMRAPEIRDPPAMSRLIAPGLPEP